MVWGPQYLKITTLILVAWEGLGCGREMGCFMSWGGYICGTCITKLHIIMYSSTESESGVEWSFSEASYSVRAPSSVGSNNPGGARRRVVSREAMVAPVREMRPPSSDPIRGSLLERWHPSNQPVNMARLAANWRLQNRLRR